LELPDELTEGASLRGNEFAWRVDQFPNVMAKARRLGFGCLGGQFQFRPPGATCEMYWLSADPDQRGADEAWSDYAIRSCEQVLERFKATLVGSNLVEEASRWPDIPELTGPSAEPQRHLCFVAYFVSERPGV
jgi:hypothetical protein